MSDPTWADSDAGKKTLAKLRANDAKEVEFMPSPWHGSFDVASAAAAADALRGNTAVKRVEFGSKAEAAALPVLLDAFLHGARGVTKLCFRPTVNCNEPGDEEIALVAAALKGNSTLTELVLNGDHRVTDAGVWRHSRERWMATPRCRS